MGNFYQVDQYLVQVSLGASSEVPVDIWEFPFSWPLRLTQANQRGAALL